MADCQPTGGYAKLATMIGADRFLLRNWHRATPWFGMISEKASELFRSTYGT